MSISHPLHAFGVPLAFLFLGILANLSGRRDGSKEPIRNYFAVGTTGFLMSLGTTITDASRLIDTPEKLAPLLLWIIIFFLLVMVSINHDRYLSWKVCSDGKTLSDLKRPFIGIIIPNIVSIIAFVVYSNAINGS